MNKKIASLMALGILIAGCTHNKPASVVNRPAPGSMNDFICSTGDDRVYFDYDRPKAPHVHELSPAAMETLCKQAAWLKKYDYNIEIVGHCDERGTAEYNYALGERRASAVKKYLEQQGICATRITVSSLGKDNPTCDGHDEDSWAKNRYAALVLKKGSCPVAQPAGQMEPVMPIQAQG